MFTDYIALARAAKAPAEPALRFAVTGDMATQKLCAAIKGALYLRGYGAELYDAGYNETDAQLLDPASELYAFHPDYILLALCAEKLTESFRALSLAERRDFARNALSRLCSLFDRAAENSNATVFVTDVIELDDGVFGDYSYSEQSSLIYQLRRFNYLLGEEAASRRNVRIIPVSAVRASLGDNAFRDGRFYFAARMAFTDAATAAIADRIAAYIAVLRGSVKKALILDLDNTLWGGVIGEDGMNGIELGELGRGRAFSALQSWAKELKNRGIILAVCSKNDEAAALEPFDSHPDMVLRRSDISVFIANWSDKASNIAAIRDTLNIGYDSMVFLDDNPFERGQVSAAVPEITVPELPEDPALRVDYLISINLFGASSYSDEDSLRTERYIAQAARDKSEGRYSDYNDYLASLEMTAEALKFTPFWYARIAELSQRSNQFNLRTLRYTEADVERLAGDKDCIARAFTLSDRYGGYGLISAIVLRKRGCGWFIENWFMSCRVLKRGVERFIINKMWEFAGGKPLYAEYIKTKKNALVAGLYPSLGFEPDGEGGFRLNAYTPQEVKITEKASEVTQ